MNRTDRQDGSAGQDEYQQKKSPASHSMKIESSPSTFDGPNAAAALATPTERLERELCRSRKFLEKMHLREEMPGDKAKNDDEDRILSRHLESAILLKDEMEKAQHELMESSQRAEEYLADLKDITGEDAERGDLLSPSSEIPAVEIDHCSHQYDTTSTARSMDMKVLLADMAEFKQELNDTKAEICRLRREVSGIGSTKTHRRSLSDPTTGTRCTSNTTSIPTVVECFGEGSNTYSQTTANVVREQYCTSDEFDDIVHQAYIASHLRISHGFVDNNWLEGNIYADGDGDDGDNDCIGGACFLGGLAEMLKRGSEGRQRKDILG